MNYTIILITLLYFLHILHDVFPKPLPPRTPENNPTYLEEIEERRKKPKRRRKPCTRNNEDKTNNPGDARWFLGHDLTFFFGDVTICGNGYVPNDGGDNDDDNNNYNQGIYEGVVPVLQRPPHRPQITHKPQRPQRPHRPHRPHRPTHSRPEKPVVEENEEDYVDDNYYRPGPVVGVPSNQVEGQEQNLSNFSPMSFISSFTRNINRFVNPWVDLFFR